VRVDVIACDAGHLVALVDDPAALGARLGLRVAADLVEQEWIDAFRFARAELERRPELFGWWTALFVSEGVVCGMGGWRGPPDAEGIVELGYNIAPALRGRGLATAEARA
jgi:RimJ/RimL family protein N-acetyltransferase